MPRKRTIAAANEFDVPCDRIFRWLVQNAGAAEDLNRSAEAIRIYSAEAPGGSISTKPGGAAGAFLLMHLVSMERPQSEYHRQVALSCDEDAAEVVRLLGRIRNRMVDYRIWARADRKSKIRKFKLRRFGNVPGRGVIHWPSRIAREMHLTLRALDVASITARVVRKIARRILACLIDADLSHSRLSIAKDAALNLAKGGFTNAEISALMDIDEKMNDGSGLKVDRWRHTVKRAREEAGADKRAGTSPSLDSSPGRAARSSRAASSAAPRSATSPRRRACQE